MGEADGCLVGGFTGLLVGAGTGALEVGALDGELVGAGRGLFDGLLVGAGTGAFEGLSVGTRTGAEVGLLDGIVAGAIEGLLVGDGAGANDGLMVGAGAGAMGALVTGTLEDELVSKTGALVVGSLAGFFVGCDDSLATGALVVGAGSGCRVAVRMGSRINGASVTLAGGAFEMAGDRDASNRMGRKEGGDLTGDSGSVVVFFVAAGALVGRMMAFGGCVGTCAVVGARDFAIGFGAVALGDCVGTTKAMSPLVGAAEDNVGLLLLPVLPVPLACDGGLVGNAPTVKSDDVGAGVDWRG
jgi:hypothetical protein